MVENRSKGILLLPFFLAIIGILFSFWNLLSPQSVPCISAGCNLYQHSEVDGFTLWWFGLFGFGILAIVAIIRKAHIGRIIAAIGLAIDSILFAIMAMTLPCMSCLVVGCLLAFSYLSFRKASFSFSNDVNSEHIIITRSWLVTIWSVLFFVNIVLLARELITPWALDVGDKSRSSTISIYFSPTCPACRKLILTLPESEIQKSTWYPITEESQDIASIAMLERIVMNRQIPFAEAFSIALEAQPFSFWDRLSFQNIILQLRLWINRAHVLVQGDGRIPLLEFRGIPSVFISKIELEPKISSDNDSELFPLELDVVGICEENNNSSNSCTE